jgi:hypothetical protein
MSPQNQSGYAQKLADCQKRGKEIAFQPKSGKWICKTCKAGTLNPNTGGCITTGTGVSKKNTFPVNGQCQDEDREMVIDKDGKTRCFTVCKSGKRSSTNNRCIGQKGGEKQKAANKLHPDGTCNTGYVRMGDKCYKECKPGHLRDAVTNNCRKPCKDDTQEFVRRADGSMACYKKCNPGQVRDIRNGRRLTCTNPNEITTFEMNDIRRATEKIARGEFEEKVVKSRRNRSPSPSPSTPQAQLFPGQPSPYVQPVYVSPPPTVYTSPFVRPAAGPFVRTVYPIPYSPPLGPQQSMYPSLPPSPQQVYVSPPSQTVYSPPGSPPGSPPPTVYPILYPSPPLSPQQSMYPSLGSPIPSPKSPPMFSPSSVSVVALSAATRENIRVDPVEARKLVINAKISKTGIPKTDYNSDTHMFQGRPAVLRWMKSNSALIPEGSYVPHKVGQNILNTWTWYKGTSKGNGKHFIPDPNK